MRNQCFWQKHIYRPQPNQFQHCQAQQLELSHIQHKKWKNTTPSWITLHRQPPDRTYSWVLFNVHSSLTKSEYRGNVSRPRNKYLISGQMKMIALNEPYSGNAHGIRGADYACYRQAARAGLPGVYKAFLNSRYIFILNRFDHEFFDFLWIILFFRTQRLQSLLQDSFDELPVANIRGEILFNTWNSLFDTNGEMSYQSSRILSFSGRDIITDRTW